MEKQFIYEVKAYAAEEFNRLAYFCTDQGECSLSELPSEQMKAFEDRLNERGADGWELVEAFFGEDGVLTIWKKEKSQRANQD
jgi:threonine synthase